MSSDDRSKEQPQRPVPTGPYAPRNNLHSNVAPTHTAAPAAHTANISSTMSRPEQPKFGSTTPLKSRMPSRPLPWAQSGNPDRQRVAGGGGGGGGPHRSHISEVQARSNQFMQPIRAGAPREEWRTKPVIDLTGDDVISTPRDFPTFSTPVTRPVFTSVNDAAAVQNHIAVQKPSVYSLPAGGAIPGFTNFGGGYVDTAKTTESIKELLEGFNDLPVPKKRGKKKKKSKENKKEVDELAGIMAGTALGGAEDDLAKSLEDAEAKDEEEDDEEEEDMSHVDGLKVTLLPHQIRGLAFLLSREEGKNLGGILADDMGLGKTIQAISLILTHPHPRYPPGSSYSALSPNSKAAAKDIPENIGRGTLVIAPLALIKQWEREIAERVESSHKLRVRVHHGPSRAKDPRDLKNFDIVITTYETIRSEHNQSSLTEKANGDIDAVGCFGIYWWRIVCDEAHTIKNRLAKGSIAACALKARYRWCLTGTPLQNNLDELQSLFKFLRIKPFNDLAVWKEQISRPMQQNKGTIAIERLRVVLGLVMLRRTKDVLKKDAEGKSGNQIRLPDRNQEKIVGEFNAIEKAFYEKLEERTEESLEKMMSGFGDFGGKLGGSNMTSALVLLLRLRQACNHPHLLAGKIHKDKDSGMGLVTPRKKKPSKPITAEDPAEEDDLTDLMGGLSVFQKKCDICFRGLSTDEMDRREVRCTDCSEDLKAIDKVSSKVKKVKVKKVKVKKSKAPKAKRGRPTVFDSDDEDSQAEEGTDTEDDDDDSFVVESEAEAESESDSDFDEDAYNQLVPSTKISKLVEIVKKETRQKNKIIVFSQFTSMLDLIEPFLQQQGIVFARYDGSMKNDDREASLRRLRGDGEYAARQWCGVLLCSLKCGALGLNLTCASRVVILEPFWNPFIEEQAIDRVHRIGQKDDVLVYKLTIADSVEERILQLQDKKRELANAAIGEGDMAGKAKAAKMSMKDIMFLFRRDAEGQYKDERDLNAKTKILKERRPAPRMEPEPEARRYVDPRVEAERDARRAREMASAYSRR